MDGWMEMELCEGGKLRKGGKLSHTHTYTLHTLSPFECVFYCICWAEKLDVCMCVFEHFIYIIIVCYYPMLLSLLNAYVGYSICTLIYLYNIYLSGHYTNRGMYNICTYPKNISISMKRYIIHTCSCW